MMRTGAHAAIVAALALLAGCAGGVTTQAYVVSRDMRGHVDYATAHGPTQVVLHSSPFDTAAVVAAMQGRNPGAPMTFGTGPSPQNYRVLVLFGLWPAANPCQTPAPAFPPAGGGGTQVSAVFCIGQTEISEARASTGPIASAQDPHFARLMQDLLSALMPYNDNLRNDSPARS
jgi:hypothetical protein